VGEGTTLTNLASVHEAMGQRAHAGAVWSEALRIHREVGNRRFEGGVLMSLGDLLIDEGRIGPSLEALDAGERVLREVDDPLALAKLLCVKGRARLDGGDADTARALLAEAEAIGARVGANAASELGKLITSLRDALAPGATSSVRRRSNGLT
jgi:hypothetical protein